jgi:hypothetical protein
MQDPRERVADIAAGRLLGVVRAVLGALDATIGAWDAAPLLGGVNAFNAARSLFLLHGTARVGSDERPWRLILKGFAPVMHQDSPVHADYWKREWLLYTSGIFDTLPAGFRAPRCYGVDDRPDGTAWLWGEHYQEEGERLWPPDRWALAARHLGRFNGTYLAARPLPAAPWLGGGQLRSWVERHRPLVARIAAAPENPAVRRWWPRPIVDAILRLWAERDTFLTALERLPQTLGHGDAIRRNLLSRRAPDGTEETVAIDWERAGHYAAGEEVGQTLSVASAFYDVAPAALPALDDALFASYLDGLRDAGWRGDPRPVRFAYAAHAALRNAFNAVGTVVPDDAGREAARQNYGHTWEALAERRAEIRPFLLARADEARDLLAARRVGGGESGGMGCA